VLQALSLWTLIKSREKPTIAKVLGKVIFSMKMTLEHH